MNLKKIVAAGVAAVCAVSRQLAVAATTPVA